MRYLCLIPALLLAACVPDNRVTPRDSAPKPPTANQKKVQAEVQETFQVFLDSMVEGDADAGYIMMSEALRAEWLYTRMLENDSIFQDWSAKLPATARTDLDLWFNFSKKHRRRLQRAELLPGSVRSQPTLLRLWNDYFAVDRRAMQDKMRRTRIEKVSVDGTGVTVQVRSGRGRMELYAMVLEGDGWKVDGFSAGSPY